MKAMNWPALTRLPLCRPPAKANRRKLRPVVGAWAVVVQVHVVERPAALGGDGQVVALGSVAEDSDAAVGGGDEPLHLVAHDVHAFVPAPARGPAGAEVVAVPDPALDREDDAQPQVGFGRRGGLDGVGTELGKGDQHGGGEAGEDRGEQGAAEAGAHGGGPFCSGAVEGKPTRDRLERNDQVTACLRYDHAQI
jgi:hypothetical protein